MSEEKKVSKKAEAKTKTVPKIKKAVKEAEEVGKAVEIEESVFAARPVAAVKVGKKSLPSGQKYYGTGRRKEATAKVWLLPGRGSIMVNNQPANEYFCRRRLLEYRINRALTVTQTADKLDVYAFVIGGGVPGQADAVSMGIARALLQFNPDLKTLLRRDGLLTRDPRMKERKKYGLKRARRAFQYTKR